MMKPADGCAFIALEGEANNFHSDIKRGTVLAVGNVIRTITSLNDTVPFSTGDTVWFESSFLTIIPADLTDEYTLPVWVVPFDSIKAYKTCHTESVSVSLQDEGFVTNELINSDVIPGLLSRDMPGYQAEDESPEVGE